MTCWRSLGMLILDVHPGRYVDLVVGRGGVDGSLDGREAAAGAARVHAQDSAVRGPEKRCEEGSYGKSSGRGSHGTLRSNSYLRLHARVNENRSVVPGRAQYRPFQALTAARLAREVTVLRGLAAGAGQLVRS